MFHVEQGTIECFPGRARASVSSFMAFTKGSASRTLLWTPPTSQRIKGCSPLIIPKEKSKRKNASRFAQTGCGAQRPLRALSGTRVLQAAAPTAPPCIRRWRRSSPLHFFLASPIDRPLSRCGGSSPQGSGCALSVTFGDTSPRGRGKKHSRHALGSLSKERQEAFPPRSWLSLRESWREAPERARSSAGRDRRKIIFPLNIAQSEAEGILNPVFVVLKSQNPEKPAQKRLKAVQKRFWMCYTNK